MKKIQIPIARLPKMNGRNSRSQFAAYRSDGGEQKTVVIKNTEEEFLESIKHHPAETQEILKAVRQQALSTVYSIQANIDTTKEEIDEKLEKLNSEHAENKAAMSVIEKILANHGTTLKGLRAGSNNGVDVEPKTLRQEIAKSIEEPEYQQQLKGISKGSGVAEMTVKTNYTRASVTSSSQAQRLEGFGLIATRKLTAYDLFPKIQVGEESNGTIRYIDQSTATRAAAAVAEGGTFPESTLVWTEYSLTLQKIGDTIPISEEVAKDAKRLAAEVEKFINLNIAIKVDTDLTTGSGVAPIISGLITLAGAYTPVASGISGATIYDLIIKMKEDIVTTGGAKYQPDFVMMPTAAINKMKLSKDTTNQYLTPPFAVLSNGTMIIDGMVVIENNALTYTAAGTQQMVVGDSRYATIYEVEGYEISVGYQGTQFAADMMTLKGRQRLALLIRNADQTGFKKLSGTTAISGALTTLAT